MRSKQLQVVEPFFTLETGDTLTLSPDGTMYVSEYSEEFTKDDTTSADIKSTYSAKFTISAEYADELVKEGFLVPVLADKKDFVNVFDEINALLQKYESELEEVASENIPECLRVEKTTVLTNLIKVLTHLKNTKK